MTIKSRSNPSAPQSRNVARIKALDSLRGMAASQVLICHSLFVFQVFLVGAAYKPVTNPFVNWMVYTPLHLLWAGEPAVIFFFVLSGFVLALPYVQKKDLPYWAYLVRRFCRIYLPYLALILLSVFFIKLNLCGHFIPRTGAWINSIWSVPVTDNQIIRVLFMAGSPFSYNIAPTTWTLVLEMRVSIIFPIIAMSVLVCDWKKGVGLGLAMAAIGVELAYLSILAFLNFNLTFFYGSFFVFGALLAKYQSQVAHWMGKRSRFEIGGFLFLALFFYSWDWTIHPLFFLDLKFGNEALTDSMAGVASLLLISLALGVGSIREKLELKPLLWLGKVSYSLYLFHPMVLLLCVCYLQKNLTVWGADILGFFLSFLAAEISYRIIEKPAIQLGRRIVDEGKALLKKQG